MRPPQNPPHLIMSNISKRRREGSRSKIKSVGDHKEFLNRITKTLYYGELPTLPCLSLPVTEISCEMWSAGGRGRSLRRLHLDAAANIARQACVSPCALVLALLYLERLNACNPDYLARNHPQDLFLVSLMVGNKFLQDDGEDDEVICAEWAESGGVTLKQLKNLEKEFLNAIDWKVFVNDVSFEAGLAWLERRVARKQARARGFYTYSDLAAACGGGAASELVRAVAAACAALTLAYVTGLVALLASAVLVSHTPSLLRPHPSALDPTTPHSHTPLVTNATVLFAVDLLAEEMEATERLRCCAGWARLADLSAPRQAPVRAPEPWWSASSQWEPPYRSSLVDPVRRWLERIDEYAELVGQGWGRAAGSDELQGCSRSWLDFGGLTTLMATMSDR